MWLRLIRFSLVTVFQFAWLYCASAQDMRYVIANAAQGVQAGNLSMFGPSAEMRIRQLLGSGQGALLYQRLASLGSVTQVNILNQYPMPNGLVVQGRALHQNGFSDWTIGFSYLSQRIEFGQFNAMPGNPMAPPAPGPAPPGPGPTPPTPTTDSRPPTSPPVPTSTDEACKRYPTLC
jgi:hypothetical protein